MSIFLSGFNSSRRRDASGRIDVDRQYRKSLLICEVDGVTWGLKRCCSRVEVVGRGNCSASHGQDAGLNVAAHRSCDLGDCVIILGPMGFEWRSLDMSVS